ncbi:uncharacterized protein PRCAT00001210001 [Priceomyces carsonii]|uniref:uncharacterized protein n=1 Tax=Priceomyces carsonii TaxID=28549 RepID=UPI002EDAFC7F|nr:unnamed protein product [Priceomyces carsonii]
MTDLIKLTGSELSRIRNSWIEIQSNNRYHKDDFITRLYSNLMAANPQVKDFLQEENVIEESSLFGDLLSYSVIYLHDPKSLNEFLSQFFQSHLQFVSNAVRYLEPMGNALVQTFKQWLGNAKFNLELENSWIKLYLFIANTMLKYDTDDESSDANSTFSKVESHEAQEGPLDEIKPLNIGIPKVNQEVQEVPEVEQSVVVHEPKCGQLSSIENSNVIQFQLSQNEKYRGFRRSVQFDVPNPEPISVKVPKSTGFQKVHSPIGADALENLPSVISKDAKFDPRKLRRSISPPSDDDQVIPERLRSRTPSVPVNDVEPVLTPRSHKRNSSLSQISLHDEGESHINSPIGVRKKKFDKPSRLIIDTSDDEFDDDKEKGFGFDPRRKSMKKYSFPGVFTEDSDLEENNLQNLEKNDFKNADNEEISFSSNARSEYLENEFKNSDNDLASTKRQSRAPVFEATSFGLKGLDPIAETEDDSASSRYESDEDNSLTETEEKSSSDADEMSSGVSTLSLHNSDYRSSISSGNEVSSALSPTLGGKLPVHRAKQLSQSSEISYMRPLGEAPMSRLSSSRSYTSLLSTNSQMGQRASLGFMRSSFVLKKEMESYGYNLPENVLAKPPTIPAAVAETSKCPSKESITSLAYNSSDDGCFDLLNSFNSYTPTNGRKNIDQMPKSRKSFLFRTTTSSSKKGYPPSVAELSTSVREPIKRRFSFSSLFSSSSSSSSSKAATRTSHSLKKPSRSSLASQSVSDVTSVASVLSGRSLISGFSFLSRRKSLVDSRSQRDAKKGKYAIKSSAHKVLFTKVA